MNFYRSRRDWEENGNKEDTFIEAQMFNGKLFISMESVGEVLDAIKNNLDKEIVADYIDIIKKGLVDVSIDEARRRYGT